MSSTNTDPTIVLGSGSSDAVVAIAFQPDGRHLLGGGKCGIRRWGLDDGQEVGQQTGVNLRAVVVSKDERWVVCGTREGNACVWDRELREKVIDVEGGSWAVWAVDISADSTRFATGTTGSEDTVAGWASVWSTTTGQRLLGPIAHKYNILGIRFSPGGEHIATASLAESIRIFNSFTGDQIAAIKCEIPAPSFANAVTPLAWSNDGQRIFTTSHHKVKCFEISTGSQLVESPILGDAISNINSIALAANNKFIATYTGQTISFLDASTLVQIGSAVEESGQIASIALSADNNYLATGQHDGKISIRNLGENSYSLLHAYTHEEEPDKQLSAFSTDDNETSGSAVEDSEESSPQQSKGHSDLLEVEVPSGAPMAEFDYNEPPSPIFPSPSRDDESPPTTSHPAPQPTVLPSALPSDVIREKNLDTIKSPPTLWILRRLLSTKNGKNTKDPTSGNPDRGHGVSRPPHSRPPAGAEDTSKGFSRMAAGQYDSRASMGSPRKTRPRSHARRNQGTPHSKQDTVDPTTAGRTQETEPPKTPNRRIHVMDEPGSGDAIVSVRLPAWLLCRASGTGDGTHR